MNIEVRQSRPSGSIHRTGGMRGDVRKAHDEGKAWWEVKTPTITLERVRAERWAVDKCVQVGRMAFFSVE